MKGIALTFLGRHRGMRFWVQRWRQRAHARAAAAALEESKGSGLLAAEAEGGDAEGSSSAVS